MAFFDCCSGGHQERPWRFARGFGFEEVSRSTTKVADALLQFDDWIFWLPEVLNLEVFGLCRCRYVHTCAHQACCDHCKSTAILYDLPATQDQAERRPEESLFKDVWLKTLRSG